MARILKSATLIVLLGVIASPCFAADVVWGNGAGNNSWVDANNWTPKLIPAAYWQDKA